MNDELRRAINVNMLRRKYDRCKNLESWNAFRSQRKHVTKIRKKSARNYLARKCEGSGNVFWKTVKPLFNNKSSHIVSNIVLRDNDKTVYKSNKKGLHCLMSILLILPNM